MNPEDLTAMLSSAVEPLAPSRDAMPRITAGIARRRHVRRMAVAGGSGLAVALAAVTFLVVVPHGGGGSVTPPVSSGSPSPTPAPQPVAHRTFTSSAYGITMTVPDTWTESSRGGPTFTGTDGVLAIRVAGGVSDAQARCQADSGAGGFGAHGQVSPVTIGGQPGCEIRPSADAPRSDAGFVTGEIVLTYPVPVRVGGLAYPFLVMTGDVDHLDGLAFSLSFLGFAGPNGVAVPAGFNPVSVTAVSQYSWWVLGSSCADGRCATIARTYDGGQTWVSIGAPAPYLAGSKAVGPSLTGIRFANRHDGWAYGSDVWTTHDGGGRWTKATGPGVTSELEIADGTVYALALGSCGSSACSRDLWLSDIHGDSWTKATLVAPAGEQIQALSAAGSAVYVLTGDGSGRAGHLVVSTDHGAHFTTQAGPCQRLSGKLSAAGTALWAFCATGNFGLPFVSSDGGRTFRDVQLESVNSSRIAAASSSRALVGSDVVKLTTDGGTTFTNSIFTGKRGFSTYLGFTDGLHAFDLEQLPDSSLTLFRSDDGGVTFHAVAIR